MLKQLNPPIPLVTPKGDGIAHFLIDYSAEYDLMWVVFLTENGECWTFSNSQIRAQKNITLGRKNITTYPNNKDKKESVSYLKDATLSEV